MRRFNELEDLGFDLIELDIGCVVQDAQGNIIFVTSDPTIRARRHDRDIYLDRGTEGVILSLPLENGRPVDTYRVFVYALITHGKRVYVGVSVNPHARLHSHRCDTSERLKPVVDDTTDLEILQEVRGTVEEIAEAERRWIRRARRWGWPIVNDDRYAGTWRPKL